MAGDGKPVQVSSSALITLGGKNFSSMQSVQDLRSLQAGAIGHGGLDPTARLKKDTDIPAVRASGKTATTASQLSITKGAKVMDKKTGKIGHVIRAAAGHTKKTGTLVHQVADKNGDTWLAKESNLSVLL